MAFGQHIDLRRHLEAMFTRRQVLKRVLAGLGLSVAAFNLPKSVSVGQAASSPGSYFIELSLVANGLDQPVDIADPRDDSGRLFVVERRGVIRIVRDGQVLSEPFLDISDHVAASKIEQGLWSIVFHPDFATNGRFYITYSPTAHEWRLERFQVSANPDRADPTSAETVLSFDHQGTQHYGGDLAFGPDGYLWVSTGDGGNGFDPYGNAQNPASLMGALLRIDVDRGKPYAIPPDNPYAQSSTFRPEIWSKGLRNPWRFGFDRLTGDLYIANVGESTWEEVLFQPAGNPGGQNYGWPEMEGPVCSAIAPDCNPALYDPPAIYYRHDQGCAVISGYVDRSSPQSPMYGTYVFADYCRGTFWTAGRDEAGTWRWGIRLPTTLKVSSFGEDSSGQMYVADFKNGGIYQISATAGTPQPYIQRVESYVPTSDADAVQFWIRGWNLLEGARVFVNDKEMTVESIDTTWLKVTVPISDLNDIRQQFKIAVANTGADAARAEFTVDDSTDVVTAVRAFYRMWSRTDLPTSTTMVDRTWLWGPKPDTQILYEPYAESPGGNRIVAYYDKGRMEVTQPGSDPTGDWFVTSGLLAQELVTGQMQLGDNTFEQHNPAQINVAGDPDDQEAPTYATFSAITRYEAIPSSWVITQTVDRSGGVGSDQSMASHAVKANDVGAPTRHNVASIFWDFMTVTGLVEQNGQLVTERLFPNPFFATGYPITEAYWTSVKVGGESRRVLVQLFQRRVLTYTPDNSPGWQVEMGNIGWHYYQWRYGHMG